jgi:hypothetical protein
MKILKLFCVAMIIATLLGCATTSGTSSTGKMTTSWIFDKDNLEQRNLSKNEIIYRDIPAGLPSGQNIKLFGRISWFNSLLETFDLHESLSLEEKQKLFDALFGFIPDQPTDEIYRAIALGKYLSDGSSLILYARMYRPSNSAPEGSKGILQFTGNFSAIRNNTTGILSFRPMNGLIIPNLNWFSNGIVFSDGILVKASYLYSNEAEEQIKKDAGNDINMLHVNLADMYIKDQIKENDESALAMLFQAFDNNESPDFIKVLAKLNSFLYYIYKDDIVLAEKELSEATELSKNIKDLDESFVRVINIESPVILELYKNNNLE